MDDKLNDVTPAPSEALDRQEVVRQAAVYASGVLSMAENPALQQLVEEAAKYFCVPMAAVSIIDRDRQWFPAGVGLDVNETAREVSFCDHAIEQTDEILTVLDATYDPRFRDNPMVTGPTHVRFYLGCPLLDANGRALGALCVIGVDPRAHVSAEEYSRLRALASEATRIITHHQLSPADRTTALDEIGGQIEDLIRSGDESLVTDLDAMLRRLERQEDRERRRGK